MQYPIVNGMAKAYPDLQILHDYYMGQGFGEKEADQVLKYMSVLCDLNTPDKSIKGRERLAAKEVSPNVLGKLNGAKFPKLDQTGESSSGLYAVWVTKWFEIVHNARLSTWFAMKVALLNQNEYLMQPIDPTGDIDKQADGRKKVAKEIGDMLQRVESLEEKLFATHETKKIVNEILEKHQFAGYPELFALSKNLQSGAIQN